MYPGHVFKVKRNKVVIPTRFYRSFFTALSKTSDHAKCTNYGKSMKSGIVLTGPIQQEMCAMFYKIPRSSTQCKTRHWDMLKT